jgi:hypothetical protein
MAYAEEIDSSVLMTLCEEPGPWTEQELTREHGEGTAAADALGRLVARGLAFKMEGGLFAATAAGRYAHEVGGGKV